MATYGTLAGWRSWSNDRGDSAPTDASDADANAALQRAHDYLKWTYVNRFVSGCTIPDETLAEAEYIAANSEFATPGFWTKTYTPSQQKVLTKVDAISWTPVKQEVYDQSDWARPVSTQIEAMMSQCMPSVRPGVFIGAVGPGNV